MTQPLNLPRFTAVGNLEGALTGALEECEEALHSYADAGLDRPYVRAKLNRAMLELHEAQNYLKHFPVREGA